MKTKRPVEQLSTNEETIVRLALVQMYISRQDRLAEHLSDPVVDGEDLDRAVAGCNFDIDNLASAFAVLGLGDINVYAATIRSLAL